MVHNWHYYQSGSESSLYNLSHLIKKQMSTCCNYWLMEKKKKRKK